MLNICTTCNSWEIGSYKTQQSRHNEHTHFCRNFVMKSAIWFSENEGGVKGRLELFQKFVRFGRPVPKNSNILHFEIYILHFEIQYLAFDIDMSYLTLTLTLAWHLTFYFLLFTLIWHLTLICQLTSIWDLTFKFCLWLLTW